MESFENPSQNTTPAEQDTPVSQEHIPQEAPSPEAGRKASPYADSPYVMNTQPIPRQNKPRKRRSLGKGLIAVAAAIALVAASSLITAGLVNAAWEERSEKSFSRMRKELEQMQSQVEIASNAAAAALPSQGTQMTPAQLYAGNVDSVVAISTTMQANSVYGPAQAVSAGSGFIFREDGYIITNHHVVESATGITVITNNGDEYEAALVGQDSTNDLAVLKIEAAGLKAAALGSSKDLIIGDMVVAIGNALGELAATQTVGYVSGINREVSTGSLTTISMIQTDAAINPGNSGGPLFNMKGEVIGITTAKYSGTTNSGASIEGIGFAIPIDDVLPLIDDIITIGYVSGAYMDVTVQEVDPASAEMFDLPTGARIVSVGEGGAADRAGIQPKDIVIALDDITVKNVTDLTRALRNYKAGDTAEVTVLRGGRELTLTITLDERPKETTPPETTPQETPSSQIPDDFESFFDFFGRFW